MEFSSGLAGVERLSADTAVVVDLAEVTWCEIFAVIGDPRAKNHLFFLTLGRSLGWIDFNGVFYRGVLWTIEVFYYLARFHNKQFVAVFDCLQALLSLTLRCSLHSRRIKMLPLLPELAVDFRCFFTLTSLLS